MKAYKVFRLKRRERIELPSELIEEAHTVWAEHVEQKGGMLDFYDNNELIASFHAGQWICFFLMKATPC